MSSIILLVTYIARNKPTSSTTFRTNVEMSHVGSPSRVKARMVKPHAIGVRCPTALRCLSRSVTIYYDHSTYRARRNRHHLAWGPGGGWGRGGGDLPPGACFNGRVTGHRHPVIARHPSTHRLTNGFQYYHNNHGEYVFRYVIWMASLQNTEQQLPASLFGLLRWRRTTG